MTQATATATNTPPTTTVKTRRGTMVKNFCHGRLQSDDDLPHDSLVFNIQKKHLTKSHLVNSGGVLLKILWTSCNFCAAFNGSRLSLLV